MDETGFNLYTYKNTRWAKKDETPYLSVSTNRGRKNSILVIINNKQILYSKIIEGAYTHKEFIEFL